MSTPVGKITFRTVSAMKQPFNAWGLRVLAGELRAGTVIDHLEGFLERAADEFDRLEAGNKNLEACNKSLADAVDTHRGCAGMAADFARGQIKQLAAENDRLKAERLSEPINSGPFLTRWTLTSQPTGGNEPAPAPGIRRDTCLALVAVTANITFFSGWLLRAAWELYRVAALR